MLLEPLQVSPAIAAGAFPPRAPVRSSPRNDFVDASPTPLSQRRESATARSVWVLEEPLRAHESRRAPSSVRLVSGERPSPAEHLEGTVRVTHACKGPAEPQ